MILVPLLAIAAITHQVVKYVRSEGRPTARQIRWLVLPFLLLAVIAVFCALGLYQAGILELLALVALGAAAFVSARAALHGDRARAAVAAWGDKRGLSPERAHALFSVASLLVCALLGHLAIESTYNYELYLMAPQFALLQYLIILLAMALLYFLFQRHGAGLVLGVGLCSLIGIAQYFIASFKGAAILPNDLFVLGTAAAVSGGYTYVLGGGVAISLACLLLASAVGCLVMPESVPSAKGKRRVAVNLGAAAALLVALVGVVTIPSYFDDLGVQMKYWYSLDYYRKQGFLTSFIAVAQDLPIDKPEGYTEEDAEELKKAYAATYDETLGASEGRLEAVEQFDETKPTVICIMNETFSDLTCLDGAAWGYDGPARYNALDDRLATGDLAVSVLGGGTCNSEFEFLTGVSLAYVGDGKYPYSLYDLSDAPSLAEQFSELGYSTTAMHPNYASNWNRDRVYRALGFDRFLSIDDFQGDEVFHSGISDEETYNKILELLDGDEGPQFIFDVTMQNHSAYDQNNIGDVPQYHVDGVSDYDNARLSEYLACIDESDRALSEFLAKLEQLDRPVVVVFFGDHQPALSQIVNDALYPQEKDEFTHNRRIYETTYSIWANYDVAGNDQTSERMDASPAYLGAMTAEMIGAPLTDFQKAQLVTREEVPAVSLVGLETSDGTWLSTVESSDLPEAYYDLAKISYLEFASKLR